MSNCVKSQGVDFSFSDKLVFVEGAELTAGRFGDVILLDPIEKKKVRITTDSYFDDSPHLSSNGKDVVFLSKRRRGDTAHGLGKTNDLYSISVEEKESIKNLGIGGLELYDLIGLDSTGQPIYLRYYFEENRYELIEQGSGRIFYPDEIKNRSISSAFFSTDGEYMFGSYSRIQNGVYVNKVFIYKINEKKFLPFLSNKQDPTFGEFDEKIDCAPGSFLEKSKVLFTCYDFKNKTSKVYSYSIEDDEIKDVAQFDSLFIMDGVVSTDEGKDIYFIGHPFYNNERENIWRYSLLTKELIKITNSNTEKIGLRVQ